jgi:Lrp/AsnC family transcriptional regulator for asnA, asnC and gidA
MDDVARTMREVEPEPCAGVPTDPSDGALGRASRSAPAEVEQNRGEGSRSLANPLDRISKRLIDLLQIDGRTSYATLAKEVGLSEAAVRHRVQRLIDHKVMQIVAVTDPVAVGFARQAMVGITASGDLRAIADRIASMQEAEYVVICAGSFDILTELVCEDDDHLLRLINDEIRAIDGVTGTEAFLYLKLSKQTYTWGTR